MRRTFILYGICLAALLGAGLAWNLLTQGPGAPGALEKLGKGDREYLEARESFLMSSRDVSPSLAAFALSGKTTTGARIRALKILQELALRSRSTVSAAQLAPLLENQPVAVTVEALRAMQRMGSIGNARPKLTALMRTAQDTAVVGGAVLALKTDADSLGKRCAAAIADKNGATVDSCMKAADALPMGTFPARWLAASYYRGRGDTVKSQAVLAQLGLVPQWWVIGCFPNQRMKGFSEPYGPETQPFDPKTIYPMEDAPAAKWFTLKPQPAEQTIDITKLFVRPDYGIAYFQTFIEVPSPREAFLLMGSDDGIRAWVNDTLVWSNFIYRGAVPDDDVVRIRLKAGVNKILLKIAQDMGGWNVVCRITDLEGRAMNDLRYTEK